MRFTKGDFELVFYGKSSASAYYKGNEFYHIGFRNEGIGMKEYLDCVISLFEALAGNFEDMFNDQEE